MNDISLPNNALKYILLQRTSYVNLEEHPLTRLRSRFFPFIGYDKIVSLVAAMNRKLVRSRFSQDMGQEYASIRNHLPHACSSILDIGCGVAGIDVLLYKHYGNQVSLYLLDKSQTDAGIGYGFRQRGEFYNSLQTAKQTLVMNGVREGSIRLLEAQASGDIVIEGKVDLVLSLISWGYHYPVSTYLDRVHALLSAGGILILDVRKGTDGISQLRARFGNCDIISEGNKGQRILCRKVE